MMSSSQKPKRRAFQFQFRILGLFALVTLFAIVFTFLRAPIKQTQIDADAAAKVEELGGSVTWGGLGQGRGKLGRSYLGAIDLTGSGVSDDDLLELGHLSELTHLVLNDTDVTDAGLSLIHI